MTVPSSGVAAFTASVLNTSAAQAATQVTAPSFNPQGTAPGSGSISPASPDTVPYGQMKGAGAVITDPGSKYFFSGPGTYPALYGSAAAFLTTPGAVPAQNGYMAVNAQATSSGAAGSKVNGLAPIGPAQGNAQNQAARPDVAIPVVFDLIFNQLLAMSQYTYRI